VKDAAADSQVTDDKLLLLQSVYLVTRIRICVKAAKGIDVVEYLTNFGGDWYTLRQVHLSPLRPWSKSPFPPLLPSPSSSLSLEVGPLILLSQKHLNFPEVAHSLVR